MERYAGQSKAENHPWCTPDHDPSSPDFVDPLQGDQREDEVSPRDNQTNSCGLIEPDFLEQGRRIIHESVEAA